MPDDDPALRHPDGRGIQNVRGAVERPVDLTLFPADDHVHVAGGRWGRHTCAERDAPYLRLRIADHSNRVRPAHVHHPRRQRAERRLWNDEPMGVRRRLGGRVQPHLPRAAREQEVGPLPVHVIVHPEDDDVVGGHEVHLLPVDQRIGVGDAPVVGIVPEGVLVRDEHVQAGGVRLRDRLERSHERRRDAGDDGLRAAEDEPVARRRVVPGHALCRQRLLDTAHDLSSGEGHQRGLQ